MLRQDCALARLATVACLSLAAATGCGGHDCKAIGLDGPLVLIAVPEELSDGAATFRMCADSSCRDGLVPLRGDGDYVVTFLANDAKWGRSVALTVVGTGKSNVAAATNIRTHAF